MQLEKAIKSPFEALCYCIGLRASHKKEIIVPPLKRFNIFQQPLNICWDHSGNVWIVIFDNLISKAYL